MNVFVVFCHNIAYGNTYKIKAFSTLEKAKAYIKDLEAEDLAKNVTWYEYEIEVMDVENVI